MQTYREDASKLTSMLLLLCPVSVCVDGVDRLNDVCVTPTLAHIGQDQQTVGVLTMCSYCPLPSSDSCLVSLLTSPK